MMRTLCTKSTQYIEKTYRQAEPLASSLFNADLDLRTNVTAKSPQLRVLHTEYIQASEIGIHISVLNRTKDNPIHIKASCSLWGEEVDALQQPINTVFGTYTFAIKDHVIMLKLRRLDERVSYDWTKSIPFVMDDMNEETGEPHPVVMGKFRADPNMNYASISFDGYGVKDIVGGGSVIDITNRDGHPYVEIYSDITQDDPTHSVSLEDAKETE